MGRNRGRRSRSRTRGSSGFSGRFTRRRVLLLGLGGIAIGGGLLSSGAYTSIGSSRSTQIPAADDPTGILSLTGAGDPGQKPVFTNQSSATMDISLTSLDDVEIDLDDDGTWSDPTVAPVTFSLAPGESQLLNVRGSDNPASISIAILLTTNGVEVGYIDMVRDFAISQAASVIEIIGTFKTAGKSGKYEFDLENIGAQNATLVAIGVNGTTNPNAIEVSSGKILTVDNTQVMSTPIPVDSTNLSTATRVDFDQNVTFAPNETKTFEFDRFQKTGSPSNADMTEQDIRITLYSIDGGSVTTNVCFGGCDF